MRTALRSSGRASGGVALRTGEVVADVVAGVPHGRTGELRWLQVTAVPDARDEQGRPRRAYAMLIDITEQRRTEAALRQSNRLLGRLREANVLGVLVVARRAFTRPTTPSSTSSVYPRRPGVRRIHWRAITPPRWAAGDDDAVEQLRRTGTFRPFEKEYVHGMGIACLSARAAVISWHPLRWTSFVVDLTAASEESRNEPGCWRENRPPAGRPTLPGNGSRSCSGPGSWRPPRGIGMTC